MYELNASEINLVTGGCECFCKVWEDEDTMCEGRFSLKHIRKLASLGLCDNECRSVSNYCGSAICA